MASTDLTTDRGRSWVVAACCCFCNFTFYGVSRLSGMMLVAATETFHVSRASAAVPFSLSTAIRNLAGVFVGHLAPRFGVGPIVATGCFIASVGAGLCFFAKDMQWLTICWGGMFGVGFGLATCLLPLAINQNFMKHSGTASGISYSGSYIGSFIFPPILVWLLDNFGLQGSFLIISGGVLNVFVAAMLLKGPKTTKKGSKNEIKSVCSSDINIPAEIVEKQFNQNLSFSNNRSLFRRNIRRVYNSSIKVLRDYDCESNINLKRKVSLPDNPYYFHETYTKSSEKEKTPSETNCQRDNCLTSSNYSLIIADNFTVNNSELVPQKTRQMFVSPSKEIITNISVSSAKENLSNLKLYSRKLDPESRSLSKGKSKAKYKMKLQKLKKVLLASLLKRTNFFRRECLQTDNVKLTSFKSIHSLVCSNSSNVTISCNHLPSSKSMSCKKCVSKENYSTNRFFKKFYNYSLTFPKEQTFNKSLGSNGSHKAIEPEEILSRVNDSLKCSNASSFLEKQSVKSNLTASVLNAKEELNASSLEKCEASKNDDHIDICSKSMDIDNLRGITPLDADPSTGTHTSIHKLTLSPQFLTPDVKFKPENARSESPDGTSDSPDVSDAKKCYSDLLGLLCEPMFFVISFTMSIQTFIVVSVVTTIEDYAKDIGIDENKVHYALMALSIANLAGTLTLGAITDRGFISRHRFLSLCFVGMALSLVAMSLVAKSLPTLLSVVVIYGLLESGVIITFPILTKQFVKGEKRQAVAIASSNVLSAPTVMLVPMLIGHFRDHIGCYTGLFHLLGATSFTCSLVWLVAPSILKRRKLKKIVTHTVDC